ncbi:biotin/lipoyl-containing protein [Candidatus Soleaferrea massiliensis]|uniref:biotin/lipoyl-containing protein n=1 Tax=Candidatus Soleaferrea massiliensis TaxID=1470354 RepID=UPI00058C679A|nr:biotin/lipoyl-containing protein [Candidatus Soleaferrea massiliensis]
MKRFNVTVNGKAYDVSVEEMGACAPAAPVAPAPAAPAPAAAPAAPKASAGAVQVKAPMPGTILDIKVSAGQQVKKGDVLVILEAMKMENEIMAPQDGTVDAVHVQKGASVNSDDVVVSLK